MSKTSLNRATEQVGGGNDSIVIVKAIADLPGGRALDTSAFAGTDYIHAGHVIYQKDDDYKPLEVSGTAYSSVPAGATLVGVLKEPVMVGRPLAAIVTIGQVKEGALPYPVTDEIKTALSHIQFI